MHAYQCGMYERCLRLCGQNIEASLHKNRKHFVVPMMGCMTHLMDNNLASLSASVWLHSKNTDELSSKQIILSVYLDLSSKIQLQYPLASLVAALQNVEELHKRDAKSHIFDRLLLCFAYRRAIIHIAKSPLNVLAK